MPSPLAFGVDGRKGLLAGAFAYYQVVRFCYLLGISGVRLAGVGVFGCKFFWQALKPYPSLPARSENCAPCKKVVEKGLKMARKKDYTLTKKLFLFIMDYKVKNNGLFPTFREMKAGMGASSTSVVAWHVTNLVNLGILTYRGGLYDVSPKLGGYVENESACARAYFLMD